MFGHFGYFCQIEKDIRLGAVTAFATCRATKGEAISQPAPADASAAASAAAAASAGYKPPRRRMLSTRDLHVPVICPHFAHGL